MVDLGRRSERRPVRIDDDGCIRRVLERSFIENKRDIRLGDQKDFSGPQKMGAGFRQKCAKFCQKVAKWWQNDGKSGKKKGGAEGLSLVELCRGALSRALPPSMLDGPFGWSNVAGLAGDTHRQNEGRTHDVIENKATETGMLEEPTMSMVANDLFLLSHDRYEK